MPDCDVSASVEEIVAESECATAPRAGLLLAWDAMNRGVPVNRRSMRAAQTTLYAAVRDGSWDVVQVKVRVARLSRFRVGRIPTESRAARRPSLL